MEALRTELARAIPEGFHVQRDGPERSSFTVTAPDGWKGCDVGELEYNVRLVDDVVIVTHGNTDAGAWFPGKQLVRATVLPFVVGSGSFTLAEGLAIVFAREPPNVCGLT